MKTTFKTLAAFAAVFLAHQGASAQCVKNNFNGCFASPGLKWALDYEPVSVEQILAGPTHKPELTQPEKDSSVVFCKYVYHKFSSTGSAKFNCVRTDERGYYYDDKGELVLEAVRASNDGEQIDINGVKTKVEDGILIGQDGKALLKTNKDGVVKAREGDVIKIKYFVNSSEEKGGKAQDRTIMYNGVPMTIVSAYENSPVLQNARWHEVFNETAVTRILHTMGLAADIMIPVDKVVCYGCNNHPWAQNQSGKAAIAGSTGIFNLAVLERKFDAKKLGEGWSFDRIIANRNLWSPEAKAEYDAMELTFMLVNYFNAIDLQNRIVCKSKDEPCTQPIPFIQDVGSTLGADGGGFLGLAKNKRGDLNAFRNDSNKYSIFTNAQTCQLRRPLTRSKSTISNAGLAEFKRRAESLTDEALMTIFKIAKFDKMEPAVTASYNGDANAVYAAWTAEIRKKINQITAISSCPE